MTANKIKRVRGVVLAALIFFGGMLTSFWVFNHLSTWGGIAVCVLVIYIYIEHVFKFFKTKDTDLNKTK